MNKNKGSKSKSYKGLVVGIDLGSIAIIIACLLMDTLWIDNLEYQLVSVSIDSFLSLITTICSFAIPYAENRTYQKYDLSSDDLNNIRGDTKTIYINLLVVSIIMFAMDALFYMFNLTLSLFGIIVVGLLFICVFVAPRIVEYAKGEDAIIDMVRDKTVEYINKNSDDFDSSEKLIVSVLLEKGFDNAISLVTTQKAKKKRKQTVLSKTDVFIFLIKEQNKYMETLSKDPNVDSLLTNKINRELLRNVLYLFSNTSIKNINSKDSREKIDAYHHICKSLSLLEQLPENSQFKGEFGKQVSSMILGLIEKTYGKIGNGNEAYLGILNQLFMENFNGDNIWFINSFTDLFFGKKHPILSSRGISFVILMYYLLISYGATHIVYFDEYEFNNYLEDIVKNKYFVFEKDMFVDQRRFSSTFNSIYRVYNECLDVFLQISELSSQSKSAERFINLFKQSVPRYMSCILSINYMSEIEYVDELIYHMPLDEKEFVINNSKIPISTYRIPRGEIDSFLRFVEPLLSRNEINISWSELCNLLSYIAEYNSRKEKYDSFKNETGLSSYTNDFNNFVKTSIGYDENLEIISKNIRSYHRGYPRNHFSFYLRKNSNVYDLDLKHFSLDFSSVLGSLLKHAFNETDFNFQEISDYNDETIKSILQFKPKYKYAPHFDEYCEKNDIHLTDCSDNKWLKYEKDYDVFVQDGAIKYNISLSDFMIREITLDEAKSCFQSIDDFDALPPVIRYVSQFVFREKPNKEGSEELYEKIKSEYYLVAFDINGEEAISIDESKIYLLNLVK